MTAQTAAGSTIAIGATPPATFDAAGYAALTLTEVGGVDKIGTISPTFAKVEFQPLKGAKDKLKGSYDSGSLSPSMALDMLDAGQILMQTAAADKTQKLYPFKVTLQDGAKRYFMGRVFGMPETIDSSDTVVMANPTVEICSDVVKVAAS
ncbi:hypothetical protein [Sphingomonas sp. VDB2]|uniref:hypothetical protein n=1 Tax=Sphingomonas sp. VDB2 TaxID=3228751 RepID=UPI003A812A0B